VFDHVLRKYVIKCVVLEGKAPCGIEIYHLSATW